MNKVTKDSLAAYVQEMVNLKHNNTNYKRIYTEVLSVGSQQSDQSKQQTMVIDFDQEERVYEEIIKLQEQQKLSVWNTEIHK